VFEVETNGSTSLSAKGTADTLLVWVYRNHEWVVDSEASKKPQSVRLLLDGKYEHLMLRSNQWVTTNGMPFFH